MEDLFKLTMMLLGLGVLIAAGFGAMHGVAWLHARRLRAKWRAERRTVHYGPVLTTCTPMRRNSDDVGGVSGSVALVDDRLIFTGAFDRKHDASVPYDQIRWIATRALGSLGSAAQHSISVQVDFEGPGGWHAHRFRLRDWRGLAEALHAHTRLDVREGTPVLDDLSVMGATRMTQTMTGRWDADFTAPLYLAPDRLIFAWQDAIPTAQITALDLYDRSTAISLLTPLDVFTQDLLRIEYAGSDGARQTVGFQVAHAQRWGDALAARSGAALTVHEGRKKKEA